MWLLFQNDVLRDKGARFLLGLTIALLIYIAVYRVLALPAPTALRDWYLRIFTVHGYAAVPVAAFLEALFYVGLYVPGTLALATAAILVKRGQLQGGLTAGLTFSGIMAAQAASYYVGKVGWHRWIRESYISTLLERATVRIRAPDRVLLFLGFYHPNGGAVIATAAGIAGTPFGYYMARASVAVAIWMVIWCVVVWRAEPIVWAALDLKWLVVISGGGLALRIAYLRLLRLRGRKG